MKTLMAKYGNIILSVVITVAICANIAYSQIPGTIILGRPTNTSITANILTDKDMDVYIEYGTEASVHTNHTDIVQCPSKKPMEVVIDNLEPDTQYYYRMLYLQSSENDYTTGEEYAFHTQRSLDSTFTFVVEADPHLDEQSNPDLYKRALINELNDNPDFLIDLGDTFMSEKIPGANNEDIIGRYLELRSYFSLICHSVPLFFVMGNHDGEQGRSLNGTANNITVLTTNLRKLYYPNPLPDDFYTGNTTIEDFVGLPQDYYAWERGDALFVVLDPYRYTIPKSGKSPDGWDWTLGGKQYEWFKQTLENSKAKFKFIFSHHL